MKVPAIMRSFCYLHVTTICHRNFYQLAAWPAGPEITLHFLHLFVSIHICVSALIMCAIIMLPCDLTLVDFSN